MASSTRQRETTKEKGQRLNAEGKVERVGPEAFEVVGSSGKYLLTKRGIYWDCPCAARKDDCSHVEAVHAARDEEMRAQTRPHMEATEAFFRSVGRVPSALGIEEDDARNGYAYDYEDEDEEYGVDEYGVGADDEQGRLFVL